MLWFVHSNALLARAIASSHCSAVYYAWSSTRYLRGLPKASSPECIGPMPEVVDESIGPADSCVSDAREATGDTGKGSPDDGVGVSMVVDINLHFYLDIVI